MPDIKYLIVLLLLLCGVIKPDPMCGIIAATNIQSISAYSQWSCTTAGVTTTSACLPWSGVTCNAGNVVSISIPSIGLTGNIRFD